MTTGSNILKSDSDLLLESWGYDLLGEYSFIFSLANFPANYTVFDVATGSGRSASILARLYPDIITADYSFERKPDAEKRISGEYLKNVKFVRLDLRHLPFKDNSLMSIVCMNTMHELDNPYDCLDELIRSLIPGGKLLIMDFNHEGLDVMDRLHEIRYGGLHPRGKITLPEIKNVLLNNFSVVKDIPTRLNAAFLAEKKFI